MTDKDLEQMRGVLREDLREIVREELAPLKTLLVVVAQSLRELLTAVESTIAQDIRENLDRKFERSGMPLT